MLLVLEHSFVTGIQYDVGSEVQHLFKAAGRYVQDHAHTGGNALEVPDVADRRRQSDVTHALTANLRAGDLHAALVAHLVLILVLDALIFTAVALPVLLRSKDPFAEQAVAFRLERAVVDGLGLGNLAIGPFKNLFRRCHADLDGVKIGQFKHSVSHSPSQLTGCRHRRCQTADRQNRRNRRRPDHRRPGNRRNPAHHRY